MEYSSSGSTPGPPVDRRSRLGVGEDPARRAVLVPRGAALPRVAGPLRGLVVLALEAQASTDERVGVGERAV
jgi:hypothetical protein